MTYLEIKTMFTSILNRTDLTTALTDTFMTLALLRAQRELRVPATEILLTTTVTGGYTGIPVPSGFNSVIQITTNGADLKYVTPAIFLGYIALAGTPEVFTRVDGKFQVYPTPATGVVLNLYYWGVFTAFSGDSSTTPLSIDYPDLLIYGALSYASDYFSDERLTSFEGRYNDIKQTIQDNASTIDGAVAIYPTVRFGDPMND